MLGQLVYHGLEVAAYLDAVVPAEGGLRGRLAGLR